MILLVTWSQASFSVSQPQWASCSLPPLGCLLLLPQPAQLSPQISTYLALVIRASPESPPQRGFPSHLDGAQCTRCPALFLCRTDHHGKLYLLTSWYMVCLPLERTRRRAGPSACTQMQLQPEAAPGPREGSGLC